MCQTAEVEPPTPEVFLSQQSLCWQSSAWTPESPWGTLHGVFWGRGGAEGPRPELLCQGGQAQSPRGGDGVGWWPSPSRACQQRGCPVRWPGGASPGHQAPLAWEEQPPMAGGSGAGGGCGTQRCCPSAGWEIPSCIPPPVPALCCVPVKAPWGLRVCPSPCLTPSPSLPWHRRPPGAPTDPSGMLQFLPGVPPGCWLLPAPPEPPSPGNGGRERAESLSFSTFSLQEGAGSPTPRALSGSPPCSLAPSGRNERHPGATAPPNPPTPTLHHQQVSRGRCYVPQVGWGLVDGTLVACSPSTRGRQGLSVAPRRARPHGSC